MDDYYIEFEAAAKELCGVYWQTENEEEILYIWNQLDLIEQRAWKRVAKHAVKESTELFGMLITPDHR